MHICRLYSEEIETYKYRYIESSDPGFAQLDTINF